MEDISHLIKNRNSISYEEIEKKINKNIDSKIEKEIETIEINEEEENNIFEDTPINKKENIKDSEEENLEEKEEKEEQKNNSNTAAKTGKFTAKAIDYTAGAIFGTIAGESTKNFKANEEELNDLSLLWAEYYELTGKKIDPKTMLILANSIIYTPMLIDAIMLRTKKRQQEKKQKNINFYNSKKEVNTNFEKEEIINKKTPNIESEKKRGRPKGTTKQKIEIFEPLEGVFEPVIMNDKILQLIARPQLKNINENDFNGRRCHYCTTPLKGKQVYFCSDKHKTLFNSQYIKKY
jgi:hypothetical protein